VEVQRGVALPSHRNVFPSPRGKPLNEVSEKDAYLGERCEVDVGLGARLVGEIGREK